MGRKKEDRTRVFYARVKPENYEFISALAQADNMNLSLFMDTLIDNLRERDAKSRKSKK